MGTRSNCLRTRHESGRVFWSSVFPSWHSPGKIRHIARTSSKLSTRLTDIPTGGTSSRAALSIFHFTPSFTALPHTAMGANASRALALRRAGVGADRVINPASLPELALRVSRKATTRRPDHFHRPRAGSRLAEPTSKMEIPLLTKFGRYNF